MEGYGMLPLLCILVLVVTIHGRKFHEQLDREDLLYYFGVQEEQQVPSYMFIDKPTLTTSKRKEGDAMLFSLTAFGERFIFQLSVNEKILTPDCVLQHFGHNGVISSSPCSDHYRPCNYHGQSLTHHDRWAAVSYCDILVGVISTSSHDLTILPLKASQFDLLRSLNWTTPLGSTYIVNKLTRKAPGVQRHQTRTRQDKMATVEIVTSGPVVDSHARDNSLSGTNLTTFLSINMNIVFSLFHDETLTYHLSPTITRITVLNNTQFLSNITNNAQILNNFADWYSNTSPLYRADLAILITKQSIISKEKRDEYDVNGLAYVSGMCHDQDSNCILAKDIGLGTAFTIAHEIGHTLKMGHDDDYAKCNDSGNIMQRFATYGRSSFHWSSCSDEAMKNFFESDDSTCLRNKTLPSGNTTTVLPGTLYDEETQCKLTFGNSFRPNYHRKDKCGKLSCCYNQRHCIDIGYPLVDGTECGNGTRTWCIKGQCVDIGPDGPAPVHGGWSSWGNWSICSRTAGGGVRWRKRPCNNPKPRYTGNTCIGGESEVRLCNIQPYGVSDTEYKVQQRNQQQAVIGRYVCSMNRTLDNITMWPPYIDGTNCRNTDPNHLSKCYRGLCKIFGCDGFLESSSAFDVCGVCNGNGSQCRRVDRIFDFYAHDDNKGKHVSFKIPAQSTGIVIRNNNADIVKLKSDQVAVGDYYYDRYDIVLTRGKNWKEIQIVGPLKQDIEFQVEMVVQHVNESYDLKINYRYHTHLTSPRQQRYQWNSNWSSCSVTCGTGFKSLVHTCGDTQLQKPVEDTSCETKEYPADNRTPCIQKACSVRWFSGGWSQCSTSCGAGTSTRQVVCVNGTECKLNACAPRPLRECHHLTKPIDSMPCDQQPCRPVWIIKQKSPRCSQQCGIGEQRQSVKCVDGTNTSVEVDDVLCKREDKPAESRMCCNKHCLPINGDNKPDCTDDPFCRSLDNTYCIQDVAGFVIRHVCPQLCGVCDNKPDCTDDPFCRSLDNTYCIQDVAGFVIRHFCPQLCGVCGCVDQPGCEDRTSDACTTFPAWAITCSKKCGFCTSNGMVQCGSG